MGKPRVLFTSNQSMVFPSVKKLDLEQEDKFKLYFVFFSFLVHNHNPKNFLIHL